MFRNWITKKATKGIEAAVEPMKLAVQKNVEQKSDWLAKLMRLGIVAFLTMLAFKEDPRSLERPTNEEPTIINNIYINERRSYGHDSKRKSFPGRRNDHK